jgi:hypothetical protein
VGERTSKVQISEIFTVPESLFNNTGVTLVFYLTLYYFYATENPVTRRRILAARKSHQVFQN